MVLPVPGRRALRPLSRPRSGVALSVLALIAVWVVATTHGPFSAATVNDLYVYGVYHDLLHAGRVPFHDFDFEYPPGALLPIWLAGGQAHALSALMLACAIAGQLAAWALAGARAGWLMILLPVVAGALVRTHFDLLPAALTLAALALIVRRPGRAPVELGLALLAAGTMTKLWPAAVAILVLVWLAGRGEARTAVRAAVVFVAVVLVIGLPFAVRGGFPSTMVRFHLDRPVQIESAAASVLEVVGGTHVTGAPLRPDRFKSNGLDGGPAGAVVALTTLALMAVSVALGVLVARRPGDDALLLAAFAIIVAFVALGKVLSPQYVCWILPLAAVVAGRGQLAGPALAAAASLVTQLWFPTRYFDVVYQHPWAVTAVAVRNLLLLLALAATARALARSPQRAAAVRSTG